MVEEPHMANICQKCSTPLADGQAFCTSCGAPQSVRSHADRPTNSCVSCGNALDAGARFCTKCGASAQGDADGNSNNTPGTNASGLYVASSLEPVAAASAPMPKSNRAFLKVATTTVASLVLLILVAAASVAYFAYRAKKKVDTIQQAYKENDINKLASELGMKETSGNRTSSSNSPDLSPSSSISPSNSSSVPDPPQWKSYTG